MVNSGCKFSVWVVWAMFAMFITTNRHVLREIKASPPKTKVSVSFPERRGLRKRHPCVEFPWECMGLQFWESRRRLRGFSVTFLNSPLRESLTRVKPHHRVWIHCASGRHRVVPKETLCKSPNGHR